MADWAMFVYGFVMGLAVGQLALLLLIFWFTGGGHDPKDKTTGGQNEKGQDDGGARSQYIQQD